MIYYIPFIAFWIACVTGIPQKFYKHYPNNLILKVFVCAKCSGLWMALAHEAYFGFSLESIAYIPLCSLVAWSLSAICIRLNILIN